MIVVLQTLSFRDGQRGQAIFISTWRESGSAFLVFAVLFAFLPISQIPQGTVFIVSYSTFFRALHRVGKGGGFA